MIDGSLPQWLAWAREIAALAQTGMAFSSGYDTARYRRFMEIASEITARHTQLPVGELKRTMMAQPGYATPKVDVRGAVIRDGQILLVRERADGLWCMPGGWADVGEIPSAMVVREIREESGVAALPRKIIGVYDANRSGRPLELYHAYKVVFLCDYLGGDPAGADETLDASFFSFDEIPPLSSNRTNSRHLSDVRAHLSDPARETVFD